MIPSVVAHGVEHAYELLTGVRDRMRDASPAWDRVADSIFAFERRWWELTYGPKRDEDQRPGRDPHYMVETGGLRASATRRGARRQVVQVRPHYVFVGTSHGLAVIHEERDRPVMGEPSQREVRRWLETVGDYIITGRA